MAGKTPPWWRGILTKAWRGIRAGLAALLGSAQPEAGEGAEAADPVEENREERPEEETALTEKLPPTPDPEPAKAEIAAEVAAEPAEAAAPVVAEPAEAPVEPVAEAAAEPEPAEVVELVVAQPETMVESEPEGSAVEEPEAEEAPEPEVAEPAVIEPVVDEAEKEPAVEIAVEPEPVVEASAEETSSDAAPVVEAEAATETEAEVPAAEPAAETVEPEPEPIETPVEEVAEPVSVAELESTPEPQIVEPPPVEPEPVAEEPVPAPAAEEPEPVTEATPEPEPAPAAAKPEAKHVPELIRREQGPDTSPVSVMVNHVYEGPFDLLLDLIRKQDIDIYDIPIAKITAQFLAYVDQLKSSDMDVAGEFIYTASLLIHIKSRMLLPRAPSGPEEEAEDPRRELVERLLEHERFKNAAQMLSQKQMLEAATWTNPGMREFREDAGAEPEIAADTVDLVRVFREILDRARSRPVIDLQEDSVTVGQMIQFLARRLTMEDKPVALRRLLSHTRSERALIAMFLALLELVRMQAILLRQDRHFSEIFIKKGAGFDAAMDQGLANARDDWQ